MAVSIPGIVSAALSKQKGKKITLSDNDVVLFQGDSITDMGRNRNAKDANSNSGLGPGYPLIAGSELLYKYPGKHLQIYNRGISGNKVFQLADRWEEDCLALKPTVLSILVGVNDYWHTLTGGYKGTLQTYRDDYRALLERTRKQFPDIKLIIGEPYAVRGVKAVDDSWFPTFTGYQQAAREIADSFGAAFIPYQHIYDQAQKSAPASYWTPDGVHPGAAGDALMAHAWLETIKG
ncbi:SGNH/GDSL hydrolase family protein [Compostibacter hankyongensis]|uniref:SGNH/GDSL hydrolase family protein n=1 Tax=Compostibacter hankyongensis TaxID=1007089 RepID=A0ABP8FR90_9BACT